MSYVPIWQKPGNEIAELLEEKEMTAKQVMRLLVERHALKVSYASVLRYIGDEFNPGKPEATVRLETGPSEEAQVDFGYVGRMRDPESGSGFCQIGTCEAYCCSRL